MVYAVTAEIGQYWAESGHGTEFANLVADVSNRRPHDRQDPAMIASNRFAIQCEFGSDRDRQLHAAATELLSNSKYSSLRQLNCRVLGGVVEITGTVSTFYLKQLAQVAVLQLHPEGRVRNLVEVTGETPIAVAVNCAPAQ